MECFDIEMFELIQLNIFANPNAVAQVFINT